MNGLELTRTEIEEASRLLEQSMVGFQERLATRPVYPKVDRAALRAIMDEPLPEAGRPLEELFAEFEAVVVPNSTLIPHPRFLGYVIASPTGVAPFAEALAATINQNCNIWTLGPAANTVEQKVIRWFAELFAFPETAGGLLVSGGSMANATALAAARDAHHPGEARAEGLQGLSKRMTLYVTTEVHNSVVKGAAMLGFGLNDIRKVAIDDAFRMDVSDLEEKVRQDRANGMQPFCVVASAASVATGAIDPLDALADFCAEENLWLHVDGAYGAFGVLSDRLREELVPAGRADSLALDPHKLMFSSLEAGCVLVKDTESLKKSFQFQPSYIGIYEDHDFMDFGELGPQLSRGFKALKVWWSIRAAGMKTYRGVIERVLDLAAYMAERIEAEPSLELAAPVPFTAVCFRVRDLDDAANEQLLNNLVEGGTAFLTRARLRNRFWLRACFTNYRTTRADVDMILEEVLRLASGRN